MINATIVANSLSPQGDRLISVLATFPRIILAEVNTHRMLSKNTSSSRAIPFNKMVEAVKTNPFIPIAWQKEHSGMQGSEYFTENIDIESNIAIWLQGRDRVIATAYWLNDNKVTKQLCNRLLEPFMWTTMLITGSKEGWDNFFELRCPQYKIEGKLFKSKKEALYYKDSIDKTNKFTRPTDLEWLKLNKGQAEIHIMDLAEKIYNAMNESTPKQLKAGEWHIPFEDKIKYDVPVIGNHIDKILNKFNQVPSYVKVSTAMAARTSYTVVGDEKEIDYQKMIDLHDRLIAQNPPHSSPMEHCARAMTNEEYNHFIKGEFMVTHSEPEYEDLGEFPESAKGWCRNFKGFIQYRHIIETNEQV